MITKDSLSQFVRSRFFAGLIIGIGIVLVLVCVFEAGVAVGYHEAVFSSHWGANYERNFGDNDMQTSMGLPDGHEPQPHGTTGKILSVSGSTLVVESSNQQEQKIVIGATTIVRDQQNTMNASSLTTGTYIVVVGDPDSQGDIDASLIRVIPAPPATRGPASATSTTP